MTNFLANSERSLICQATRIEPATVTIRSRSLDGPYHLSAGAAERLQKLALRPLEWFNLAAIHGPIEYWLHDDFYDEEGNAYQPECEVTEADRFACPTLEECSSDVRRLIDFALTRWSLTQPVIECFDVHIPHLLEAIQDRFGTTRNEWIQVRLLQIVSEVLGRRAEEWFDTVLQSAASADRLSFLHAAYRCLPHHRALSLTRDALALLPRTQLARECLVLAKFRDDSILDWIEANVHEPLTQQWGDLAAASAFDWDRASRWLESGRPLSLIALDALIACGGPHPGAAPAIKAINPRLQGQVSARAISDAVLRCGRLDCAPRVRKAAQRIVENLPSIVSAASSQTDSLPTATD